MRSTTCFHPESLPQANCSCPKWRKVVQVSLLWLQVSRRVIKPQMSNRAAMKLKPKSLPSSLPLSKQSLHNPFFMLPMDVCRGKHFESQHPMCLDHGTIHEHANFHKHQKWKQGTLPQRDAENIELNGTPNSQWKIIEITWNPDSSWNPGFAL